MNKRLNDETRRELVDYYQQFVLAVDYATVSDYELGKDYNTFACDIDYDNEYWHSRALVILNEIYYRGIKK